MTLNKKVKSLAKAVIKQLVVVVQQHLLSEKSTTCPFNFLKMILHQFSMLFRF